jgi:hypothetical protein
MSIDYGNTEGAQRKPVFLTGFIHSGLKMPNKASSKNYVIFEMHRFGNCKEFSFINTSFQGYNENEDCE